jgi:hypothetical protein
MVSLKDLQASMGEGLPAQDRARRGRAVVAMLSSVRHRVVLYGGLRRRRVVIAGAGSRGGSAARGRHPVGMRHRDGPEADDAPRSRANSGCAVWRANCDVLDVSALTHLANRRKGSERTSE